MQTVKVNVVATEINYKGKLGLGLIQYGTVNENYKPGKDERKIIWEGKTPTKVHVIPTTKENYHLIEIDDTKGYHINYGSDGLYNIQDNAYRKVRFFKCKDHPFAVVDAVTINGNNKSKKTKKNSTTELSKFEFVNGTWKIKDGAKPTGKIIKVELGIDHSEFTKVGVSASSEEKREEFVKPEKDLLNLCAADWVATEQDTIIKILADFAEKLDKDFNLMSVCDVNPRKYAEDYVKRELRGNKIDLDKETSEFKEFLESNTKHHSEKLQDDVKAPVNETKKVKTKNGSSCEQEDPRDEKKVKEKLELSKKSDNYVLTLESINKMKRTEIIAELLKLGIKEMEVMREDGKKGGPLVSDLKLALKNKVQLENVKKEWRWQRRCVTAGGTKFIDMTENISHEVEIAYQKYLCSPEKSEYLVNGSTFPLVKKAIRYSVFNFRTMIERLDTNQEFKIKRVSNDDQPLRNVSKSRIKK
jgi:hypothetical protein